MGEFIEIAKKLDIEKEAKRFGANYTFAKPFETCDLLEAVYDLL